jgi:hypothetical protein
MRALAHVLVAAALLPGCSILFAPSSYSTGDEDAAMPLDVPPSDVGDAPSPLDVPGVDAPVDPAADYWPETCASGETRTLLDADGEPITPSTELRTALAITDRVGIISDRRLTAVPGDALGRVVMGRTMASEVFVAVASDGPGAPTLLEIDRGTVTATAVPVTNFPAGAGAWVVDLAMARMGAALRLVLLIETATDVRVITGCNVDASGCALETPTTLASGYFPMVIGLTREGSDVHTVTMGPTNESGSSACSAEDGDSPLCDSTSEIIDRFGDTYGDGVESTGGLLAVFATSPDLTGALPGRLGVNLIPSAPVAAFEAADSSFTLVRAQSTMDTFELRNVNVNCLGGGGCLPLEASDPAFMDQPGVPQIVHAAPLTGNYAFSGLLMGYDDSRGTDVRLYALDGDAGLPLAARPYVTLGTGRLAPVPGNGRSMAMTAVSDGASYDVFVVTIGDVSGIESAYLSAIRYCR